MAVVGVCLRGDLAVWVWLHADCAPLVLLVLVIRCFLGVTSVSAACLCSLSAMSASEGAPCSCEVGVGRVVRAVLLVVTVPCVASIVFVDGEGGGVVLALLVGSGFCFLGVTPVSAACLCSLSAISASGGAPCPCKVGAGRVARVVLLVVTVPCVASTVVDGGGCGVVLVLLVGSGFSPGSEECSFGVVRFSLTGFLPCAMAFLRSSRKEYFGGGFAAGFCSPARSSAMESSSPGHACPVMAFLASALSFWTVGFVAACL